MAKRQYVLRMEEAELEQVPDMPHHHGGWAGKGSSSARRRRPPSIALGVKTAPVFSWVAFGYPAFTGSLRSVGFRLEYNESEWLANIRVERRVSLVGMLCLFAGETNRPYSAAGKVG